MPICYERWCHQYSEAGQSSQKTSLWIKVLTGYDHIVTENDRIFIYSFSVRERDSVP